MYTGKISSQGQITLPKHIREQLHLTVESPVTFEYSPTRQEVTIKRAETLDEAAKRISSYIKPGTKPLKNVREFIENSDWVQE